MFWGLFVYFTNLLVLNHSSPVGFPVERYEVKGLFLGASNRCKRLAYPFRRRECVPFPSNHSPRQTGILETISRE